MEISDAEAAEVLAKVFYEDAVAGSTYWTSAVAGLHHRGYKLVRVDPESVDSGA